MTPRFFLKKGSFLNNCCLLMTTFVGKKEKKKEYRTDMIKRICKWNSFNPQKRKIHKNARIYELPTEMEYNGSMGHRRLVVNRSSFWRTAISACCIADTRNVGGENSLEQQNMWLRFMYFIMFPAQALSILISWYPSTRNAERGNDLPVLCLDLSIPLPTAALMFPWTDRSIHQGSFWACLCEAGHGDTRIHCRNICARCKQTNSRTGGAKVSG